MKVTLKMYQPEKPGKVVFFLTCEQHLTNLYSAALSTSGECFALSVDLPSASVATPRASALDTRPCVLFKGVKSGMVGK